jgi:magnesium chelatase accessory protein
MSQAPAWDRDGRGWPNRAASRFVRAGGLRWHVQVLGSGPALLLAHGTGSSTHSWRALAPLLARHFTVVAPDLPGHGFTEMPPPRRLSLPGMSDALGDLLNTLNVAPAIAAGHSAGAAILARMSLEGLIAPRALVSLNGALLPLYGLPGKVFAPLARVLAGLPLVPQVFAWHAGDRNVVERLLRDTGSTLDAPGVALYAKLAGNPVHASAALAMMAHWDLEPLLTDLPRLQPALLLIVGSNDRTIAPEEAQRVRQLVPGATLMTQQGLGHLAHEEAPDATAALIVEFARATGVLAR